MADMLRWSKTVLFEIVGEAHMQSIPCHPEPMRRRVKPSRTVELPAPRAARTVWALPVPTTTVTFVFQSLSPTAVSLPAKPPKSLMASFRVTVSKYGWSTPPARHPYLVPSHGHGCGCANGSIGVVPVFPGTVVGRVPLDADDARVGRRSNANSQTSKQHKANNRSVHLESHSFPAPPLGGNTRA